MNLMTVLVTLPMLFGSADEQQTFADLQVVARGMIVLADGGELEAVGSSTGPIVIGQTSSRTISMNACGNLTVGSRQIIENPVNVWSLDVTPLRVQGRAVTFRVDWKRTLSGGRESQTPG